MKVFILDASVILNFLLAESPSAEKEFSSILKQAKAGEVKLSSTCLLPLEVGNGLRYTLSDDKLALEVMEKFLKLPIELFPLRRAHYLKILALSYPVNASFYDASYHFLATVLKGVFLTSDYRYFKKAKKLGNIKLL